MPLGGGSALRQSKCFIEPASPDTVSSSGGGHCLVLCVSNRQTLHLTAEWMGCIPAGVGEAACTFCQLLSVSLHVQGYCTGQGTDMVMSDQTNRLAKTKMSVYPCVCVCLPPLGYGV